MGAALAQAVSQIKKPTVMRERIEISPIARFLEVVRAVHHPKSAAREAFHIADIALGGANDS
jgi:hypothetical protein